MARAQKAPAGEYTVMGSKLLVLVSGKPGSTENPPEYEEFLEGESVELSEKDATRHSQHTVAVFVNPDSDHDRRVRLVPMVVKKGDEQKALAEAPTPEGVAVVVPPDSEPEGTKSATKAEKAAARKD